ncbi:MULTISPECIES: hypothetical protein [Bizionia]|uniref:Uncharacterized protein n=1 Tax=Bizionia algoritergicola TaxID=291187 RepID=A0A5D0QW29_9FLAO|nr:MULTISPECIES: hypothetical protein [Bizionia]OBX21766.1 hypothetical protein BAA08_11465 [Bizionia sp. APA-3]TYB73423.1 hypothetical protein ES675_07130 [Bizionia algoritergicola]
MKSISIIFCFLITSVLFSQENLKAEIPSQKQLDSIKVALEILFKKDQTFRRIYTEAEEKLGKDSFEMNYFWEVVEADDKILEKQVTNIINKFGWLGISQVGRLANDTQWSILQHGSVTNKEKYAPLLKASVLKNESQATHYVRLVVW